MNLTEIPEYREKAMKRMAENQRIKDYLTNTTNSTAPADSLVNQYIFPYWYIPGTTTTAKSLILMSIYVPKIMGRTIKKVQIKLGVLTHQSIIICKDQETNKTRLRHDLISLEIDRILNGSTDFGFKLELVSSQDWSPMENFHGTILTYETYDFNYKV